LRSLSHSFRNSVLRLYFRQKENACNHIKWSNGTSVNNYLAYQEVPLCHGTKNIYTKDVLVSPVYSCLFSFWYLTSSLQKLLKNTHDGSRFVRFLSNYETYTRALFQKTKGSVEIKHRPIKTSGKTIYRTIT
jgi:hypothetical protein